MRLETRAELVRRIRGYLDAGTTAMAEGIFRNPVGAYTSKERFARERDLLFRRYPLVLGMSCQLQAPGDYLTADVAGMPILLVRAADGRVRAFVNICRHRGAPVVQGSGSGKRVLSCPYHGWSYDLEGCLVGIPGEDGFPELPRGDYGLQPLAVSERYGLLWVRPSAPGRASALDIDAYLSGLGPELESYGFAQYHHFETRRLQPRINWKMAIDTFLEAYHLSALHRDTLSSIFMANVSTSDTFGAHHRLIAVRRSFAATTDLVEAERDFLRHTLVLYTLFPSSVFIYQADHIELWRISPDREREDACTVELSLYVPEPVISDRARRYWAANLQLALDAVDGEDFPLGESIQRGFYSGAHTHVTYGRNEPALIHFHRSLRQALGLSDDGP
jgi:phenylpropionate dioxygenase-like ring-hydroxylating dioxygenase large terminal subunit